MQANTYCMGRLKHLGGMLCMNQIPLGETRCDSCKPKPVQSNVCAIRGPNAA